jgi:hypothetical protein
MRAANSVGWLALAIALTVVIPHGVVRIAAVSAGALLAVLVGLSRIYLRAHYASDVLAGESSPWRCTRSRGSARSRGKNAASQH